MGIFGWFYKEVEPAPVPVKEGIRARAKEPKAAPMGFLKAAEKPVVLKGRLSDSGDVLFVYCPSCGEHHQHRACDLRRGQTIDLLAKCRPHAPEPIAETPPDFCGGFYTVKIV